MLAIVVFVLTLAAAAQAGIDYSRCEEISGGYGVNVECPPYWSIISVCVSGGVADCNDGDHYTVLQCCPEETPAYKESRACDTMESDQGVHLQCGTGLVVQKVCTSLRDPACGLNIYQRIECCNDHTLTMGSYCHWMYSTWGVPLVCPEGEVVTGMCSSGRYDECNSNYHGLYCCSYED